MPIKINCAGQTDIGKKRDSNQDQFFIADLHKSMLVQAASLEPEVPTCKFGEPLAKLMMVADGMGGHKGGSRASRLAIELLVHQFVNSTHWLLQADVAIPEREKAFVDELKIMLKRAHHAIELESKGLSDLQGMGTTLTMACIVWPWMYVVHAGDSRCYLMRGDELRKVTHDHTVSSQMVEKNSMTQEEAQNSPWNNVLYNALGAGANEVQAELHRVELQPHDQIVICSDGMYRYISDAELRGMLLNEQEPQPLCEALIQIANARGGADNITAIVAQIEDSRGHVSGASSSRAELERLLAEGDASLASRDTTPSLTSNQDVPNTVEFIDADEF
ncbi:PP2C family protein-serine/threonine phosphatase [Aureliella helgolandensis]|uniref:Serine/threonine phosphatase stp n=1 Tax=Aureliella helgolandensis TaxID=2527968 RepID=A0A518GHP2_9BACT|nr:protein phosphatase 2C domain-containing protein [Aureliella helgolandensis]QDV28050.1 Serine/threonine phosphatase stp [Aureliella helgolandensis]